MLFLDIKLLFTWIEKLDRQIPTKPSIQNAGTPIISRKKQFQNLALCLFT